jgi:hypothetical protein
MPWSRFQFSRRFVDGEGDYLIGESSIHPLTDAYQRALLGLGSLNRDIPHAVSSTTTTVSPWLNRYVYISDTVQICGKIKCVVDAKTVNSWASGLIQGGEHPKRFLRLTRANNYVGSGLSIPQGTPTSSRPQGMRCMVFSTR